MFFDRKLSVGPQFFNLAFTPFMIALGLILPIGAMLPWKRGKIGRAAWSLRYAGLLALALCLLAWAIQTGRSALGPVGLLIGSWVVFGALVDLWLRAGRRNKLRRLMRLPRADWGKATAHIGLGVTIFAVAGLTAWEVEDIRVAQIGEPFVVGSRTLTLTDVRQVEGPNYVSTTGIVTLEEGGRLVAELMPEKRIYPVAGMPTTEAAIDYRFLRDVYVVIGDHQANGGWTLRTYVKPLCQLDLGGLHADGLRRSSQPDRSPVPRCGRGPADIGNPGSSRMKRLLIVLMLLAAPVGAVEPDEILEDPGLETRAREISKDLRCLVCRNESIDESNADLARDLRLLVRERLTAGDTDEEVLDYVVDRYGEFVLLKPTYSGANLLLWAAGPLMLLLAVGVAAAYLRSRARRPEPEDTSLSAEEEERLRRILEE